MGRDEITPEEVKIIKWGEQLLRWIRQMIHGLSYGRLAALFMVRLLEFLVNA